METETGDSRNQARPRCLRFLNANHGPDQLNFLYNKYKNNKKIMNESNIRPRTNNTIAPFEPIIKSSSVEGKEEMLDEFMSPFSLSVYDPVFFGTSPYNPKEDELKEIEEHFKQGIGLDPLDFVIYETQRNPSRTLTEDLVIGAEQIHHLQLTDGFAPVLFLGRTPFLLQLAYEEVIKFHNPSLLTEPHILHLNFSGTPDTENIRKKPTFDYERKEDVIPDETKLVSKNLVTPEKLAFYFKYMDAQGMNTIKDKIYLADVIGTGAGLNSFLRLMRYYYEDYSGRAVMPDVHFIALNLRYETGEMEHAFAYTPKKQEIYFHSIPDVGIRPLKIKTTTLQLSEGTLSYIDFDILQDLIGHGISFPAQNWRKESWDDLKKERLFSKAAYQKMRPIMQDFIKNHHDIYVREANKILY